MHPNPSAQVIFGVASLLIGGLLAERTPRNRIPEAPRRVMPFLLIFTLALLGLNVFKKIAPTDVPLGEPLRLILIWIVFFTCCYFVGALAYGMLLCFRRNCKTDGLRISLLAMLSVPIYGVITLVARLVPSFR